MNVEDGARLALVAGEDQQARAFLGVRERGPKAVVLQLAQQPLTVDVGAWCRHGYEQSVLVRRSWRGRPRYQGTAAPERPSQQEGEDAYTEERDQRLEEEGVPDVHGSSLGQPRTDVIKGSGRPRAGDHEGAAAGPGSAD